MAGHSGEELRVSVVIPTFQRREQVLGAVDSALAQTVLPAEVIVVDDGSTDGTAEAVNGRYGERVRLLCQPNQGPSAARNAAIAVATGDVIAFLDSDDRWLPHHLTVIAELFARHPAAVLVGTHRNLCFGADTPAGAALEDLAEDVLLCRMEVGFPTSVGVRRAALHVSGGFDEQLRYGEDNQLYVLLALEGPFCLISANTLEHGRSADSLAREGHRIGAFAGYLERSADRALVALDHSQRADAGTLRAAARARRAMGVVLTSLVREEPIERVRDGLAEARRWMPGLDAEAAVMYQAQWVVPGWDEPEQRRRVATTLREAGRG